MTKAVLHAIKGVVSTDTSVGQKGTETSLIEQFMYPKLGPGQLWEEVARLIEERGGEVHAGSRVVGISSSNGRISDVQVRDEATGKTRRVKADYFFSTMPVKELIESWSGEVPDEVREVAGGLVYRDFITVGLLLRKLKIRNQTKTPTINGLVPDNWVYIQERDVRLARLQVFNNWSPYMVKDDDTVWIGLEYLCTEGDDLWSKPDDEFARFAIEELARIEIIDTEDVLDSVVIRMKKTYPAYFGTYDRFDVVRSFTDRFENLFLIGRNGMHRYNNQDHSMLTAMIAVDNVDKGITSKDEIWSVNVEQEYHEEK